jgi:hypothetical protein
MILKDILTDGLDEDYLRTDSFQPQGYRMELGLIFSDKLKVMSSPSSDFPTEAVVTGLRAAPRDIIGIFMNFSKGSYKFLKTKTMQYVPGLGKEIEVADRVFGEDILRTKINDLDSFLDYPSEELQKIGELTVYDYLVQLAKKHRLPIYNLEGDLVWPESISHTNIVDYVDIKN